MKRLDLEIYKAEKKIDEGSQKLQDAANENNNEPNQEEQQVNLDSLDFKKPELPETETETTTSTISGNASNDTKESIRQLLISFGHKNNAVSEVNDMGEGIFEVIYTNRNERGKITYHLIS